MSTVAYGDISPRTAAYAEKELLKRGTPYLVFEKFGQSKALPANNSKTMKFRRYAALNNTPVALTEGVTPASQSLTFSDVTANLTQYGGLVQITDVVLDTHEDDVLNESITLLGEQAAQMIERMRYGQLIAGTNVIYAGGGTTRASVNNKFDLSLQRKATRTLKRQNARPITSIVRSTPAFNTENVAPAFVAVAHPDLENDIRTASGFVPAEKYGAITPWENEIGKIDDCRYLLSTVCDPITGAQASGTAPGSTWLTTDTVKSDVYPILYFGRDAYGIVALKGQYAVTPMVVNPKPSDSDPLAQRGSVSWKGMQTAVILNDFFMNRVEVLASA